MFFYRKKFKDIHLISFKAFLPKFMVFVRIILSKKFNKNVLVKFFWNILLYNFHCITYAYE